MKILNKSSTRICTVSLNSKISRRFRKLKDDKEQAYIIGILKSLYRNPSCHPMQYCKPIKKRDAGVGLYLTTKDASSIPFCVFKKEC